VDAKKQVPAKADEFVVRYAAKLAPRNRKERRQAAAEARQALREARAA